MTSKKRGKKTIKKRRNLVRGNRVIVTRIGTIANYNLRDFVSFEQVETDKCVNVRIKFQGYWKEEL